MNNLNLDLKLKTKMILFTIILYFFKDSYDFQQIPIAGQSMVSDVYARYEDNEDGQKMVRKFDQAYVEIIRCKFNDLRSEFPGGALYTYFSDIFVNSSTYKSCCSPVGGSMFLWFSDIDCHNSIFEDSHAFTLAGGVFMADYSSGNFSYRYSPSFSLF